MLGLRQKFVLGSAGLLAIVGLSAGTGMNILSRMERSVSRMMRANYDSVVACQHMGDAIHRLDDRLLDRLLSPPPLPYFPADPNVGAFDQALGFQESNITEPGEAEATGRLARQWLLFKVLLAEVSRPGLKPRYARDLYDFHLQPLKDDILQSCHDIAGLNLDAMPKVERRARILADEDEAWVLGLLLLACLLSVGEMALLGRWVLDPIRSVTHLARGIAAGNLDLVVAVPSRDEVGALAESFNSMAANLREARRSDRARLLKYQQATRRTLNSLRDAVAFLGPDGLVELSNPSADRLFDLKSGAPPGPGCPRVLSERLRACLKDEIPYEPRAYTAALQIFDEGRERFFLPRMEPVLDGGLRLAGLAAVLVDVTELRHVDELKSGLVATVSHELKTPLTGLRMALHLLLDEKTGPLEPQQEELLLGARQDTERLRTILENLLDMGRLEAGLGADLKPVPAGSLVDGALEAHRVLAASKGVRLEARPAPAGLAVLADEGRLSHVFSNLVVNAIRHTPGGGSVAIGAREEGAYVRFSVKDDGEGIPEEFLPRLFQKFFRVPGQPAGSGAGLGLAIAKEIVEAHGGKIQAAPARPRGCEFSFTLSKAGA